MRIQKLLARAGVSSRREAERLMSEGRVRVNGEVVTELGRRADPERDEVTVDGRPVRDNPIRWILLHKPVRHLTTKRDPRGRATVYDLLPEALRQLPYVGRLDWDTAGLLLFTNDGDVAHRLLHPSSEVEREYEATVEGIPTRQTLRRLTEGVELEDGLACATRVEPIESSGGAPRYRIVIREGRKREVRRLWEAVGHPVSGLRRVRFGPITLKGLSPGHWRELSAGEVRALRSAAGKRSSGGS